MNRCWASDSLSLFARVYIRDNLPGEEEIWQVPINGTPPRKLDLKLDKSVYGFALHPDGRQIAFVGTQEPAAQERSGEVWVLENFLPAVKGSSVVK